MHTILWSNHKFSCRICLKPKLSDFFLDLHQSLAHQGFAKILDISAGMPAVFANPYASRSQHISSPKIPQLRLKANLRQRWTATASTKPVVRQSTLADGVSERIKKQIEFLTVESACGGLQPAAGFFNKRWHGKNSSNCYWRYSVCMIFLL